SPISRRSWVWIGLAAVAVFLAAAGTNFSPSVVLWLLGFITYLCRILALAVLVRAILSWFMVNRYSLAITLLDDLTDPVLSPLRRAIPPFGGLDLTPLIAMVVLYAMPSVFARLVTLFLP
ncbi:MAG: YggT family protein, partial [Dehalococcoidia bacterium]|nr:YggT family protein [Dehalococcoidia bacterium]